MARLRLVASGALFLTLVGVGVVAKRPVVPDCGASSVLDLVRTHISESEAKPDLVVEEFSREVETPSNRQRECTGTARPS
jgi:hypothetical protein